MEEHGKIAAYLLIARVSICCGWRHHHPVSVLTGSPARHAPRHRPDNSSRLILPYRFRKMIRKSGREDELVHPPVFTFAAWHQMRKHQTEQQTDAQHTAAVHKPLHDNGALFIIKLQICRIHLLLRDNQLVFNFWFSSFSALITLSLPATSSAYPPCAGSVASMLFSLSVSVLTGFQIRDAGAQAGLVAQLFQRDPGGTAVAVANLRVTGAVVRLQYRHFFPALMVPTRR